MIKDFQQYALRVGISKRASAFTRNSAFKVVDPISELDDQGLAHVMRLPRGHLKVLHLAPPGGSQRNVHRPGAVVGARPRQESRMLT